MPALLLAALLPTLYWPQPADTAEALRKAGVERLYVVAGQEPTWRKVGFDASPFDKNAATQADTPSVEYRMDVASATHVPWIDANGWRFERHPAATYFYEAHPGAALLSAAEAYAYGVTAAIAAAPADLPALARMLKFLHRIDRPPLPVRANIGIIDNGSDTMGEVLNLMARHNLLFHVIAAPDPAYDLNIRLGSAEYPEADAADPYSFAMMIRRKLTDEKRLLRIYGTNVVLGRLTGDQKHARLHLLNYSGNAVKGLRVRVLGAYDHADLAAFDHDSVKLRDYAVEEGATEFSIPEISAYAVVDLVNR